MLFCYQALNEFVQELTKVKNELVEEQHIKHICYYKSNSGIFMRHFACNKKKEMQPFHWIRILYFLPKNRILNWSRHNHQSTAHKCTEIGWCHCVTSVGLMDVWYLWKDATYLGVHWFIFFKNAAQTHVLKGQELFEKCCIKAYIFTMFCREGDYNYVFKIDFSQMHTLYFIVHEFKGIWSSNYLHFFMCNWRGKIVTYLSVDPAENSIRGNIPLSFKVLGMLLPQHISSSSLQFWRSLSNITFCCFVSGLWTCYQAKEPQHEYCILRKLSLMWWTVFSLRSCCMRRSWWATTRCM